MEAAAPDTVSLVALLGALFLGFGVAVGTFAYVLSPLWETIRWYRRLCDMHRSVVSTLARQLNTPEAEVEKRLERVARASERFPELVKQAQRFEIAKQRIFDPLWRYYQQVREIEREGLIERIAFAALREDIRLWLSVTLQLCPDRALEAVRPVLVGMEDRLYAMAREEEPGALPERAARLFRDEVAARLDWDLLDDPEVNAWLQIASGKLHAIMSNWQCVVLGVEDTTS